MRREMKSALMNIIDQHEQTKKVVTKCLWSFHCTAGTDYSMTNEMKTTSFVG